MVCKKYLLSILVDEFTLIGNKYLLHVCAQSIVHRTYGELAISQLKETCRELVSENATIIVTSLIHQKS